MLKKTQRIERSAFSRVLRQGRNFSAPHLTLKIVKAKDKTNSFSFVVSKKAVKSSVGRNRLRRRGYHALKEAFPFFEGSYDGIFFAKKGIAALSYRGIKEEMCALLQKVGVLR